MNKEQLVKAVSQRLNVQEKVTNLFLTKIIETIAQTLAEGNDVLLVDFGKFTTKIRKQTIRRNPQTGEFFEIPETTIVIFKVSKKLKRTVAKINHLDLND